MNTAEHQALADNARKVGLSLWRRLASRRHVAVTNVTIGNEWDAHCASTFRSLFVNGHECTVTQNAYHRLNLPSPKVDAVVVLSVELYAGIDDVCIRPVPIEWRAMMSVSDDVEVVHLHVCGANEDAFVAHNALLWYVNGWETVEQLRSEGVHIGYDEEHSLNPTAPMGLRELSIAEA